MKRSPTPVPCYAMTMPGLEPIAAEEIEQQLSAMVTRQRPGIVVFRLNKLDRRVLRLRTVEDVFLYLWGTDSLTYRAADLKYIERWTATEPNWPDVLRRYQAFRPKSAGRRTYRIVTQMRGEHGYRRLDAGKALARAVARKLPPSWQCVDEDAAVEIWLTIRGQFAICGLRLSDRTMRHRRYKRQHRPGSLRPVVAAAMVRLLRMPSRGLLVDPMCGAGTILAEWAEIDRHASVVGGDHDRLCLDDARVNLSHAADVLLVQWDAQRLPLADQSISRLACNPPFGGKVGADDLATLYRRFGRELTRVVAPRGRVVLLVADWRLIRNALPRQHWRQVEAYRLRVLGRPAVVAVWDKLP